MNPNEKYVTTSFESARELYMSQLTPLNENEQRIARRAFVAGMQFGVAILQNRMAVTTREVNRMEEKDRQNILLYLGSTCMTCHRELDKMNMTEMGIGYGHA